jgi:NADH-quinone oxidoreductase subunit L
VQALLVGGEEALLHATFEWATIGGVSVRFGLLIDGLAASVLVMVAAVAAMVFIYATGYMQGDPRYAWFFAVFSLFTASMFGVVASSSLLMLLVCWEIMGLCSFLLIGFWYERAESRSASMKAFLTTRVGDMGFLAAVILLLGRFGTLDIPGLVKAADSAPKGFLFLVTALLFCGAVSKSAQFPLHIWLPDAMAGPTPVSGLLHSATMVAAGVYMVARVYPIFEVSGFLPFVAGAGMFSAIFAAALALTETDIKRTLAYSTMSQLGYMMAALGAGGYVAAIFHLITHGFFKSLLFLSAGSVIHGAGTQDIRELGGLGKRMKWTAAAFLVGALALAGIPPLAGFFSKDAILTSLWGSKVFATSGWALFLLGLGNAVLSAFYMFRVYFSVFRGEERTHAHESPRVMLAPMIVLAVLVTFAGVLNLPVGHPLLGGLLMPGETEHVLWWLMALSAFAAAGGVYVAWDQFRARISRESGQTVAGAPFGLETLYAGVFLRPVFAISEYMHDLDVDLLIREFVITPVVSVAELLQRADIDLVYTAVFSRFPLAVAEGLRWFDERIVDQAVLLVGGVTVEIGRTFKRLQTGMVANYALLMVLIGVVFYYVARWLNQ